MQVQGHFPKPRDSAGCKNPTCPLLLLSYTLSHCAYSLAKIINRRAREWLGSRALLWDTKAVDSIPSSAIIIRGKQKTQTELEKVCLKNEESILHENGNSEESQGLDPRLG